MQMQGTGMPARNSAGGKTEVVRHQTLAVVACSYTLTSLQPQLPNVPIMHSHESPGMVQPELVLVAN